MVLLSCWTIVDDYEDRVDELQKDHDGVIIVHYQ